MSVVRDVMTPKQVAEYLQLHPMTVYRFISKGEIPASKIGGQYRIKRKDIDKLLDDTVVEVTKKEDL